ncbi:MAG: ABC transporter permease [Nostoc sp. EkiNYC01]|nr:ABC transporter permease [Nostoc sp. EkiNYC01]
MKFNSYVTFWGIYSVWHRHAKVYQKTWLVNVVLPLSEPIIYLISFGYGLSPLVEKVSYGGKTIPYLQFLVPGLMGVSTLFQAFFEASYGSFIRLQLQKTWQGLLTAPLSFTEVFLGDWLWAATKGTIAGTSMGVFAVLFGFYPSWQLLISLPIIFLGSLLFAAAGLFTAGTVRTIDEVHAPVFLFIIPMFCLCGIYYPRDNLPAILAKIVNLLPLSLLVDLLRCFIALPPLWSLKLIGLLSWTLIFAILAWQKIYPKLFT